MWTRVTKRTSTILLTTPKMRRTRAIAPKQVHYLSHGRNTHACLLPFSTHHKSSQRAMQVHIIAVGLPSKSLPRSRGFLTGALQPCEEAIQDDKPCKRCSQSM